MSTRRENSPVYEFFDRDSLEGKAICIKCKAEVAYHKGKQGQTSNLITHLNKQHAKDLEAIRDKKPSINTQPITNFLDTPNINRHINLIKFVVKDQKPISIVDSPTFRALFSTKIPCVKTLTSHILQLHQYNRKKLFSDLKLRLPSITTDTWSSKSKRNYSAVTCHWITDDWELKYGLFDFVRIKGQTAININKTALEPITSLIPIFCAVSGSSHTLS